MFADAALFRSLASLHRAGVPWPEAMASAAGRHPEGQAALESLQSGKPLSEAMASLIEPMDLALLRAGESSGTLETTLERIAARHEQENRSRGARRAALIYPVLMAHIAALLLPLPDFIAGHGGRGLLWALAVLVPTYVLLWLTRSRSVKRDAHPGVTAPRARGLFKSAVEEADARALMTFADSTDAGVPINEVLDLTVSAGAGGRVAFDCYRARPAIAGGAALHTAWKSVPPDMARELSVAEQSGELGTAARHLAARLQFDVEMRRKKISALLPLVVILVVGGIIAVRLIGFYMNLYGNLERL